MAFLRRLLGSGSDQGASASDPGEPETAALLEASEASFELHERRHRLTVWLRLLDPAFENEREQLRLFGLEDRIMRALDESGAGEHDTNSLERGYLALRLVGEDADSMAAVVVPLLDGAPAGSYLALRRGPAGTAEERLDLGRQG